MRKMVQMTDDNVKSTTVSSQVQVRKLLALWEVCTVA